MWQLDICRYRGVPEPVPQFDMTRADHQRDEDHDKQIGNGSSRITLVLSADLETSYLFRV
jgi:hypothetical protein